jgi:hypothetical protein
MRVNAKRISFIEVSSPLPVLFSTYIRMGKKITRIDPDRMVLVKFSHWGISTYPLGSN